MRHYLNNLPQDVLDLLHLCGNIALSKGMSAYLVGGFVRDLILREENLDIDIAVRGDGLLFAQDLAVKLNAKLIRHRRFGTAVVVPKQKQHLKIDIATTRKEVYLFPAALPVVESGTLRDDLKRRDFTINAIAVNITGEDFGTVIDLFGGREDLNNGIIRVLHDLSFIDDPLRILRAIRFEQRFGFRVEARTFKLLKEAIKDTMLEKIEPQRLRDELILALKEKKTVETIKRINSLAGFGFLKPGFKHLTGLRLLDSVKKEIAWFDSIPGKRRALEGWLVYFMALTDSLNKEDIEKICASFAFKKSVEKRVLSVKEFDYDFRERLSREGNKPSEIFALLEPLSYEAIIFLKAKYKNPYMRRHIGEFLEIYTDIKILVSGHHLKGLGIAPGPVYQKIFSKVLKAKLDGAVKTVEEEIAFIKKLIKEN